MGIDRQRAAISVFANAQGIVIRREIVDSSTAYAHESFEDRVRLQDALKHCELSSESLLVHAVDRLVRRLSDMQTILGRGIRVISVLEGEDRARLLAAAAAAEVDAEQITTKTRMGQKNRSSPPMNLTGAERQRGIDSRDLERERRDQILLDLLLELPEGATYKVISEELNKRGHRAEQGSEWTIRGVERPVKRVRERIAKDRLAANPNFGRF